MNEETIHRLALIQLPGIGDLFAKLLTEYFKGAKHLFKATKKELSEIPGVGRVLLATLCDAQVKRDAIERAVQELAFVNKHNIKVMFYDEDAYPEKLKECHDGPFVLFYKGTEVLNKSKIISIVGTRKATAYGEDMTHKIVEELSHQNILVISGLAYGIDAFAHKFAVEYNCPTVGVLAHGLDKLYPQKNRSLAKKMLEKGGLLTEFFSGTNPDRENFPKRNRIVAGIADATIIIEATEKGGSLITANIANSYSRDVFAVPGRRIDLYSQGCNNLIRANKAALISSGKDVLEAMSWLETTNKPKEKQLDLFAQFNPEEQHIISIIQSKGVSNKEYIANSLNKPVQKVSGVLFNLELNGVIKSLPGNNYQIKA